MILLGGAVVSAILGYRLMGWWVPTAVACATLALQAAAHQGALSTAGGMMSFMQILAMTGLISLFLFHAIFSIARSLGLRRARRR